jgi:hypothetical protein
MTEEDKFHLGKPPVFDGNNYDYWKKRMEVHFKALGKELWITVMEGYVILDPKIKSDDDVKNEKLIVSDGEIWTTQEGVNPCGLVVRWG